MEVIIELFKTVVVSLMGIALIATGSGFHPYVALPLDFIGLFMCFSACVHAFSVASAAKKAKDEKADSQDDVKNPSDISESIKTDGQDKTKNSLEK